MLKEAETTLTLNCAVKETGTKLTLPATVTFPDVLAVVNRSSDPNGSGLATE